MKRMGTIEKELWNIFTYYSLHGNTRDPSKLSETQFIKLCKDSAIMDSTMCDVPLNQATLHLLWTSAITSRGKAASSQSDKLDYCEFLSCLVRVAIKCYPTSPSSEDAMQQLLMDNILSMAKRRRCLPILPLISHPMVAGIYTYYEDALSEIFRHYANNSDHKSRNMMRSISSRTKTFDEEVALIAEAKERSQALNHVSNQMGYVEFLSFANEFGLVSSMALTNIDLGDIYLTVISETSFEASVRRLTFAEFWEVLVRCAFTAFRKYIEVSTEDKLKAMFLYIWRHMQHSISSAAEVSESQSNQVFTGGLLKGAKILNERFIMAWNKDGFRDYLGEKPSPQNYEDSTLVEKLIRSQSPLKKLDSTNNSDNFIGKKFSLHDDRSVVVYINDGDDLGDERIKPSQLRKLLQAKPDISALLFKCIIEEGLDKLDEDEDDDYRVSDL